MFFTVEMSAHDNEDLIDYEDEHDIVTNGAITSSATNGAVATSIADAEGDKDKKKFSGIHSIGFRYIPSFLKVNPYSFFTQ